MYLFIFVEVESHSLSACPKANRWGGFRQNSARTKVIYTATLRLKRGTIRPTGGQCQSKEKVFAKKNSYAHRMTFRCVFLRPMTSNKHPKTF
jgi:hypothetical protein